MFFLIPRETDNEGRQERQDDMQQIAGATLAPGPLLYLLSYRDAPRFLCCYLLIINKRNERFVVFYAFLESPGVWSAGSYL